MNVPLSLARVVGPNHPVVAKLHVTIEKISLRGSRSELLNIASPTLSIVLLGKYAEAEQLHERSPAIDDNLWELEHPEAFTDLNIWACLLSTSSSTGLAFDHHICCVFASSARASTRKPDPSWNAPSSFTKSRMALITPRERQHSTTARCC